jgi:hypothetical protein
LALTALVLGNLALDFALWQFDDADGFVGLLVLVAFGTAMCQAWLLAVWFACAEGGWKWRFGVPVALMGLVGYTAAAGIRVVGAEPGAMLIFPLVFQLPLFVLVAFLWPFCRLRGWRFTTAAAAVSRPAAQFRIADLIAWMTIIGVLLALLRFLVSEGRWGPGGLVMLMAFLVLPSPLLWAILVASFSAWPARSWRLAVRVVLVGLYTAGALAACVQELYKAQILRTGLPGSTILLQSVALSVLFFVAVPSILALNCLALRGLGWRLARPAADRHPAVVADDADQIGG